MRGEIERSVRMMKVPPLSLVGMERLPLPLPFSPELLWRYGPMGPNSHAPGSPSSAAAAAAGALSNTISRAVAVASSLPYPIATQLPFAYDIKHTIPIALANDPRLWSREDVLTFLQWCEREFDLPTFDTERFQMNGKALCLLTKADLELRAPCSGDVIHNALQLLMNSSADSPLTPQTPSLRMPLVPYKGAWPMADLHYPVTQQNGTTSVTLSPAPSLDGQGSPQEHGTVIPANHLSSSPSSSGSSGGANNSDDSEYDSVGESSERSPPTHSHSPPLLTQPQPATNLGLSGGYIGVTVVNPLTNGSGREITRSPTMVVSSGQSSPSNKLPVVLHSPHIPTKNTSTTNNNDGGEYNNNGRLLWDFLQQLLNDPSQRYNSFIAWKNVETGIFKIVDPPGLARLWGIQKNHLSMNYDKMSRALRYYYRVNILRKVQGERHCYQFLRNPGELKSIKNISMLRHSPSAVTTTTKTGTLSSPYVDETEYMDDDLPTDLSMDSSERHVREEDSPTDLSMDSERHHYHSIKDDDYYGPVTGIKQELD